MYSYTPTVAIKAFGMQRLLQCVKDLSVDKLRNFTISKKNYLSAKTFGYDENSSIGWGIDTIGKAIRIPGTALVWGDEFFKTMAKYSEQADLAMQHAIAI
jgi:hypothetical protein